jgi:GT2 family glycosyltransferase
MRSLLRRLPPIAWRDAKLEAGNAYIRELQEALRRRGIAVPPRSAASSARVSAAPRGPVGTKSLTEAVLASGLFDAEWYARQLGGSTRSPRELVEHYLMSGHREGLSATPHLLESWYLETYKLKPGEVAAFGHYVAHLRQVPVVHPLFPASAYRALHPDSVRHVGGVLGHYLENEEHSAAMEAAGILPSREFDERSRAHADRLFATRGYEHLPRQFPAFDFETEAAYKRELLGDVALLRDRPLVSVVLPTMNRAHALRSAVQSVLEQTYDGWELLVVDDGGSDHTPDVMAEYAFEPRISYVRHDVNRGVAAARNTALAAATGEYVAYLDSDNTWRPDFLELMLRHLERHRAEAAYSATALVEVGGQGRRAYRGMPFIREALRERNYIDCIALVHRRDLLERTGAFDESLRRTVDWDLLIRIADATTPSYAPFIGSEYDLWAEGGDRITTDVSEGYRHRVRQRTLVDWEAVRAAAAEAVPGVSIVVAVSRPAVEAGPILRRAAETVGSDCEIVVVDNHLPDHHSILLAESLKDLPSVRIVRTTQAVTLELARNFGAAAARRQKLVFMHEQLWAFSGWETALVDALESAVAAQPLVLTESGTVWSAGTSFASGRPARRFVGLAGDAPEVRRAEPVDAASHACLAVRFDQFAAVEGFDPLFVSHADGADLSIRLRQLTGLPVHYAPSSLLAFHRDLPAPRTRARYRVGLQNERELTRLWASANLGATIPDSRDAIEVSGYRREAAPVGGLVPVHARARTAGPLRWAIKIGPQYAYERESWGDFHFAESLRDALEKLGHVVTIDGRNAWYRPTAHLDDIVLVLQGRGHYHPSPHQVSALWMISHPAEIQLDDLSDFDQVFGASELWCRRVDAYLPRPARLLLQCTDPERFRPVDPDASRRQEVLMVGNARGVRPAIDAALKAGLLPAVYGKKWSGLLPEGSWKGEYLPNRELASYYASAGVVLNDHWDEMAEWGLLSNRLFDLAACGARVVSDAVPGLHDVFGDLVATYESPDEMAVQVARLLAESPDDRTRRLELAETVRRDHSFTARAATISAAMTEILSARRGAGASNGQVAVAQNAGA